MVKVEGKLAPLPAHLLQVGDVLDADLYDGRVLLLPTGTVVTAAFLERLRERRISAVSTASRMLQERLGRMQRPELDEGLLRELKAAEAELQEAAGMVSALVQEIASAAQESVSSFLQCLAENKEPNLAEVTHQASSLLNHALATREKERVILNLYDMKSYDPYTYTHSANVAGIFAMMQAETADDFDQAEAEEMTLGALLHDAGKVNVPVQILTKPGRLTEQEYEVIKTHTTHGYELLKGKLGLPDVICQMARSHHERYDGAGYPDRLSPENTPISAAQLSVCDVFDALVTRRPYKEKMDTTSAVRILAQSAGSQFSPLVVNRFLRMLGMFPNGSYVELSDGKLAMVVEQTAALMRPKVRLIGSLAEGIRDQAREIDLSRDTSVSIKRYIHMVL